VVRTEADFREAGAESRVQSVPLSHLSIELGHLYFEDFADGPDRLRRHFEQVAPWVSAVRAIEQERLGDKRPRISTCFLIDDYFGPSSSPAEILPGLVEAARSSGLDIDYIARESACAQTDGVPLAELVQGRIVADPPPGSTGARPPVSESGWLSNGQRSPGTEPVAAMAVPPRWRPPVQNAANRHSVFVDVQLWDEVDDGRRWSCAYLASVWQLLRLGLLRYEGLAVAEPVVWDEPYPATWSGLPAVVKVNRRAAPFCAYRTMSVLHGRFFATEQAVRTILSQVAVEAAVADQVLERAAAEGLSPPIEVVDRLEYVFTA
jgi:hypothetical protein